MFGSIPTPTNSFPSGKKSLLKVTCPYPPYGRSNSIEFPVLPAVLVPIRSPLFAFIKATQKSSAAENVPEPISKMIGLSYIVLFSIG